MTKVIVCLIQYLVLITMQMVSQITVCENLDSSKNLKVYAKKGVPVEKCDTKKELKTIGKIRQL
jgi:hypothetical protein